MWEKGKQFIQLVVDGLCQQLLFNCPMRHQTSKWAVVGDGVCKIALDLSHSYIASHTCLFLPAKLPRKLCIGMGQKGWLMTLRQEWGEGSKHNSGRSPGSRARVCDEAPLLTPRTLMVFSWGPARLETVIWVGLS